MAARGSVQISGNMGLWNTEVLRGNRFSFGKNWSRFISLLNDDRIMEAERSLLDMLELETLRGLRFLDIGSGSGLFSLAAMRLGALVHSFDFDPVSVNCTRELRSRYFPHSKDWLIDEGSVLDRNYLGGLGTFDIVYSWGVLHHTGAMWEAMNNAASLVAPGGRLFVAIYNDQGRASRAWLRVKMAYGALPGYAKWLVLLPAFARLWGPTSVRDILHGRPGYTWRSVGRARGMDPWRDVVDWVGGLPFEVASPEAVFAFFRQKGFALTRMTTCAGGHGCNQFVFKFDTRN